MKTEEVGTVLVTGAAGFIGFHLAVRLLADGHHVVGVDSLNQYYDVALKQARLERLIEHPRFKFVQGDLADASVANAVFSAHGYKVVFHLAAQAGVRWSLEKPMAYVDSNLVAFVNVLEGVRRHGKPRFVFASSSSVYGANEKVPFSIVDRTDRPLSLYAATKKANEELAYSYSHLFGISCVGLRFFTVYGPWGRPDMAYYSFSKAIVEGTPIRLFNQGHMARDFTFVDDVVEVVVRAGGDSGVSGIGQNSRTPDYRVYNVGNSSPIALGSMVEMLEKEFGRSAIRQYVPMQPGDVQITFADVSETERDFNFAPATSLVDGLKKFAAWFRSYHRML